MIINTNTSSLTATNALSKNERSMNKSIEKLASGMRINKAADDAAGLAVSEKMKTQIRGLDVAKRNIQDGISLVQTAEGALNEVHEILQRMRELNVQAANGIYDDKDKLNIKAEGTALIAQIKDIADKTAFNGVKLLDGSQATGINIQTGINATDVTNIAKLDSTVATLAIDTLDISDSASLAVLDTAIETTSKTRATLGATQNRLEHSLATATNTHENMTAAESRIRDVDMATEMANYSAKQVLMQAGMSIAAQANQKTSMITKLLN